MKNKNILLLISAIFLCFGYVSCGVSDFTSSAAIKVKLPYYKYSKNQDSFSTARAADGTEAEFTITLTSPNGEETVRTGMSGESITFEGIAPGVYSLKGTATVENQDYEGSQEKVEAAPGVTTKVSLLLKKIIKENPAAVYKPGLFTFDDTTGCYKFYFQGDELPPTFKKGSLVKFTFGGIPTKTLKGGFQFNYYGWDDVLKKYQQASNFVTQKKDYPELVKFEDSVYFYVSDDIAEPFGTCFDMFYETTQLNENLLLQEFECKYELVESTPNDRLEISASPKGLRIIISKLPADKVWKEVGIRNIESNIKVMPVEEGDELILYWPFDKSFASYVFNLEGYISSNEKDTDVYIQEMFASSIDIKDTGFNLDSTLYEKYKKSKVVISDSPNSKKFTLQSDLEAADFAKIIPGTKDEAYLEQLIFCDDYEYVANFDLMDSDISSFKTGFDYLESPYLDDFEYFVEKMQTGKEYWIASKLVGLSSYYDKQLFYLGDIDCEHVKTSVPTNRYLSHEANGTYIMFHPIGQKLNQGDYVMLNVSGTLNFKTKEGLGKTGFLAAVQDASLDEFWDHPKAPWRSIIVPTGDSGLEDGEEFFIQYGFYIAEDTSELSQFQMNFLNETDFPDEADSRLVIENFKVETTVYPAEKKTDGTIVSTIKLIDYTKVSNTLQMPLAIALPATGITGGKSYSVHMKGAPSVNDYSGILVSQCMEGSNINPLTADGLFSYTKSIAGTVQVINNGTFSFTPNEAINDITDMTFNWDVVDIYEENKTLFIEMGLSTMPTGSDFNTADAVIENFSYTITE